MKTIKKYIKPKRYTYIDRPADVEEFRFGTTPTCERVIVYRWADNGDIQITHVKGDGRTTDFQMYLDVTIPNGTTADVEAALNRITKVG